MTVHERNLKIIETITAAAFYPNEEELTDEEAKLYAAYFDEQGYEIGIHHGEFFAIPPEGAEMNPYILDEAMEPIREARQLAMLEEMEANGLAWEKDHPEVRERCIARYQPLVEKANAENCRYLLGDLSTDENARKLCQWLLDHTYSLTIDRKGRMRTQMDGHVLYPRCRENVVRRALGLGDDHA